MKDVARSAPKRGRELRAAAAQLDIPWARTWPAIVTRENFGRFVLRPMMDFYARAPGHGPREARRAQGPRHPRGQPRQPHGHAGDPRRAAVAPAQEAPRWPPRPTTSTRTASSPRPCRSSSTRCRSSAAGAGMGKNGSGHLDKLLDQGWNLLLFPEGTRTRDGGPGPRAPRRRGAGRRPQPVDRPDPRDRDARRDAARAAVAQAPARQGLLRAAIASTCPSASRSARWRTPRRSSSACRTSSTTATAARRPRRTVRKKLVGTPSSD